jgi:hypothetical protein
MIELIAEDEDDFVEKSLTTPRPCTIWMRGDFDQAKIDEAAKRRGIFFLKTNINGNEGSICLQQRNRSLDLASALKSSQIKWQEKESMTQTQ